jgi:UDP-N-acetylglucosamine--N-acetylmuramyl-(pentapeptide) pyrophosphoryl-undecaprenol N-acetylglucosamine transferase
MKQSVNFLLSGGGTAGHIYPAVAIANEMKKTMPNAKFLFVGAKGKMEMEKVPEKGYEIIGLNIAGIHRKKPWKNLLLPLKILQSFWKAFLIVKKFKPTIAIGTGGYASFPTIYVAKLLGVKTLLQEQNSFPGITNKILAKKADCICVAYDGLEKFFPKNNILKTGNPVRQDLLDTNEKRVQAIEFFNLEPHKKTVLIVGGSLGAKKINELIEKNLDWLLEKNLQLIWQTGKNNFEQLKKYQEKSGVHVFDFIQKMDFAYAASDYIISRTGGIIAELCIVGKPVILIPSPNVAEDHQTKNAEALANSNAALILKETAFDDFKSMLNNLTLDPKLCSELSRNIKQKATPNATKEIAQEINRLINLK